MTDLFKCKKSGTQCCAPKSKIQEQLDRHNRNYTYPYNPNVGPINPNYPPPPQYYNNYPQPSPIHGNYPPPPHVYEPTIQPPQQPSTISYEIVQQTTPKPPQIYSKYVCGVKGTSRVAKSYLNSTEVAISSKRRKRSDDFERELANVYKTKSTERLVLGSNLIPIPIVYNDNHTSDFDLPHDTKNFINTSIGGYRQARVVGGEDGENGEWCWQVALINSLNQYLCGGALIGEFIGI